MRIGIDLGGTNIRIGQVQNGDIIRKVSAPSPSRQGLEESIVYLKQTIDTCITPECKSIGIGVPSVLDSEKGVVYNVTNIPAWIEVPLKEILESHYSLPVYINNDSNCFTLGEKRFGEGKPFRNMVGITLGTGVGAGVIINHQLYNGSNTGAGEIGCIPYLERTYEDYCGSNFFTTHHQITGAKAAELAAAQDPAALQVWKEYGTHLGNLIQATLFAYDPDAIIFGGGIASAYPFFAHAMQEAMQSFPYPQSLKNLQIRLSVNPDIAILGAAALGEK
ncbi:ROK family protein [Bacteroides sp. 51]|uniref:ROK family protein n=1 Tax=Bacteroides sp. 51 TaxID=2302938 RepID=UPI0013D65C32|nr:ROK family protein [Bacteroides sp. 51]NDV82044.1 ROK family protein [Bacteroides sp. 51]